MNSLEQPPQEPSVPQPAESGEGSEAIKFDESPITNLMAQEAEAASSKTEAKSERGSKLRRLVGVMSLATSMGMSAMLGSSLERQQHDAEPRNVFERELWKETDMIKSFFENPEEGKQKADQILNDRLGKIDSFLRGGN